MDWMQTIILVGTFEGFLLLSALIIKNLGRKNLNHYFFLLVAALTLALLAKLLFTRERFEAVPHFWYVLDLAAFVIGPLWYLTIRGSIDPGEGLGRTDRLLLLPSLQYFGFVVYLLFAFNRSELIEAGRSDWPLFRISFFTFCLAVSFVNGVFLFKSYRLILENKGLPALFVQGQKLFLSVLVLWVLLFVIGIVMAERNMQGIFLIYDLGFVSLALIVFAWGYLAVLKPEYFYFLTQTYSSSENYVLQEIAQKVLDEIETHQLYLDKDFSLGELAQRLQSNTVVTSKAINRVLGLSFSDLINQQRVAHFLRLARDENKQRLTHWALAQESGFGNKVSFYKFFRKVTGATPKVYLSQHED